MKQKRSSWGYFGGEFRGYPSNSGPRKGRWLKIKKSGKFSPRVAEVANNEQLIWAEEVSDDEHEIPEEEEDEEEDSDEGSDEVNAVADENHRNTIRSTSSSNL